VTTTWLGVVGLELEFGGTVVGSGVGVDTGVERDVRGGGGGTAEVVTGVAVVTAVVEGAAACVQPGVVPHAVPSKQLIHAG
jgi:hypothetical protein